MAKLGDQIEEYLKVRERLVEEHGKLNPGPRRIKYLELLLQDLREQLNKRDDLHGKARIRSKPRSMPSAPQIDKG